MIDVGRMYGYVRSNMKLSMRILSRMWFYFRIGYATYLTFLLGYVSTLVTVYYLAIKNLPTLLDIFPRFVPFAFLATIIGGPLSIVLGWLHLKRSPAYSSEADVYTESNPYTYKFTPGVWREAVGPLLLELLLQQKKIVQSQKLLKEEEIARMNDIETKMRILLEGGYVGAPRRKSSGMADYRS